jgi:hypothetical protein
MAKQRVWIAGAAVVAALAAVPLAKAGQASAQPAKVAQAQVSAVQAAARPEQSPSQPQALNREGRAVRVVYGAPASAR